MKGPQMTRIAVAVTLSVAAVVVTSGCGGRTMSVKIERKTCVAPDGVEIVYSAAGAGERAELFGNDYAGSLRDMVSLLFHKDADPALVADAEKRMSGTPPEAARAMFLGMAGYDMGAAARRLQAPLRAINGDLYPTDVEANRKIKPDFEAVIMKHMGHYPMLERPAEFNRLVAEAVRALTK